MSAKQIAIIDEHGRPADGSSTAVVPWWSFTKTLIAACALRLVEDGRLVPDEPLASLPFTLRQLLQHRAGVGNYGQLAEYHAAVARQDPPWTDNELFAHVPPRELVFEPGEGWAYSNVGYLLARREIERAYGAGLSRALADLVLRPLELPSSRLAETPEDMQTTQFEGYGYDPRWVFHGTVIGPVVEAAMALHKLLGGELLAPSSRAALLSRYPVGGPIPGRPWVTTGYGLGLMMGEMQRPGMAHPIFVVGHSAGGPGSVGAVYHATNPDRRRTVACFVGGQDDGIAEDEALQHLTRDGTLTV